MAQTVTFDELIEKGVFNREAGPAFDAGVTRKVERLQLEDRLLLFKLFSPGDGDLFETEKLFYDRLSGHPNLATFHHAGSWPGDPFVRYILLDYIQAPPHASFYPLRVFYAIESLIRSLRRDHSRSSPPPRHLQYSLSDHMASMRAYRSFALLNSFRPWNAVRELFERISSIEDRYTFTHNDLHIENILFCHVTSRWIILDFSHSMFSHPLHDYGGLLAHFGPRYFRAVCARAPHLSSLSAADRILLICFFSLIRSLRRLDYLGQQSGETRKRQPAAHRLKVLRTIDFTLTMARQYSGLNKWRQPTSRSRH